MRNKFLLDTNIIIYYFNGIISDENIHSIIAESFNISIITKIEFLSWSRLIEDQKLNKKAIKFISNANVYSLDDTVAISKHLMQSLELQH